MSEPVTHVDAALKAMLTWRFLFGSTLSCTHLHCPLTNRNSSESYFRQIILSIVDSQRVAACFVLFDAHACLNKLQELIYSAHLQAACISTPSNAKSCCCVSPSKSLLYYTRHVDNSCRFWEVSCLGALTRHKGTSTACIGAE